MNKKIIKYLIWTIIITAVLILMPGKETRAVTVKYSTFKTSKNLFCLNKGQPFHVEETFTDSNINGSEFTFPNNNNKSAPSNVLKYIISESCSEKYGKRTNISNYIPQIAIWKLAGYDKLTNQNADKLIANADAYKKFCDAGAPQPTIAKDGKNVIIKYYKATGSYNGTNGEYTNLLVDNITVTGATYSKTTPVGNGYYNRIYTKNADAAQVVITAKYEKTRNVSLKKYTAKERESTITEYTYLDYGIEETCFLKIGSTYRCAECGGLSEANEITSKAEFEDFIDGWTFRGGDSAKKNLVDEFVTGAVSGYHFYRCGEVNHNYYIKVSGNNVKLFKNSSGAVEEPTLTKKTITKVEKPQNLLYGEGSISTSQVSKTLTFGVNLTINKVDALTNSKLSGAKFSITFTNVKSIDGNNGGTTIYRTTDANGQINLKGIIPNNYNDQITVTITETEVPYVSGYYYKDKTSVKLTFKYSSGNWSVSGGGATISNSTASVTIKNQPYIKLNGNVWEDGQIGEKNVSGPNGLKDSGEKNLQGVIVELCNANGTVVRNTTTDANGNYSFGDIPRTNEGYIIRFKYNGINYKETPYGTVSKPTEDDRAGFNNKFKTISQGQSNNGTSLGYTYNNGTSTLNSKIDGYNQSSGAYDFQISATTGTYKNSTENINCGLVKKEFDLAIGTDVKEAKLKINEKETTYNYAQIMNGNLNADFQNSSSNAKDIIYNLYLYKSDYNYRISDYKTDTTGGNIANTVNSGDNTVNNYESLKELEAYVTYSVVLKSQTTEAVTTTSTVEEFVYYYDSAFEPYNIVSTDKYNVSIDSNARKITFTSKNGGFNLTSSNNYRATVDLTFKINKDSNGNIITKTATNVAEITKYSTSEGGLIDKDSAPANGITNGKITQYEDDTDEAKGLNIVLRTEEARTISGTVFDDTYSDKDETKYDKDGKLNNNNNPVDDVIVQLIEIKKIGGQYYEYIWQETRSGSNKVKTTARNGYAGTEYTNTVETESGKFEFKDFIPGNYIIRYIYGDGKTYDVTDNVKKYNGQDYKSTIDSHYTATWYNTAGYTAVDSVARDNEARRLEVMSYSTTIDGEKGQALANKTEAALENTWMCAETSKINIPVDADNTTTEDNITTASYGYTKANSKVLFGNMNFGLALRPQENIVLEKHITALKVTPSGTGVQSIVDAKAENIEKIVNGTTVEVKGVTDGLAIIKSTRDNRGFWQVATDVEELMQGAELEVEYTYVIRNDSEEDYLTTFLIGQYEKGIGDGSYNAILNNKSIEVKNATKGQTQKYGSYLGEFYYTGLKGTNDELVSARVEKFEEALNNDLVFDETTSTAFKTTEQSVKKQVVGVNKNDGTKEEEINTVVQNKTVTDFLEPKLEGRHIANKTADWSRTIELKTTLATVSGGELGANLPSYIAEILQYSNAAGRKDIKATPANLGYVHSNDTTMTMENSNEQDEFWAETIIITKPTGEDKLTPLQIVIITISSLAVIGAGIILIKKFVLKK